MFGVTTQEAFEQAASIKPEAAAFWQTQLEKINLLQFQSLFNQIPQSLISTKAKTFALELIDQNQRLLLNRDNSLMPTSKQLRSSYLEYKTNANVSPQSNLGYFGKLLQQEKQDVAIVREIIAEYDGDSNLALTKIDAILSQSDRVLSINISNNSAQIEQYRLSVKQQAQANKKDSSQSYDWER